MPMLPKNSIRSHVAGNVNNANATAKTSNAFKKSPVVSSSMCREPSETLPESTRTSASSVPAGLAPLPKRGIEMSSLHDTEHVTSDDDLIMNGVNIRGRNSMTIRSARLRSRSSVFDIVIRDGHIAAIVDAGDAEADDLEIDAVGNLVTESFVNTHLHLDKVFTLEQLGEAALADYQSGDMGKAMSAIEKAAAVKESQDPQAVSYTH